MLSTRQTQISVLPASQVFVSRVIPEDVQPKGLGCAPQTLDKMPSEGFRDLGTIRLAGTVPSRQDVIKLVDQKACQMGADAIYFQQMRQDSARGKVNYQVVAEVFVRSDSGAAGTSPGQTSPGESVQDQTIPARSAVAVTIPMQPQDGGSAQPQPSLQAPVIPIQTGSEDQSGQQSSPDESPTLSPGEILMRPVEPESGERSGGTQEVPLTPGKPAARNQGNYASAY